MLKEAAVVVKAENQDIWVRTNRQSVCGGCAVNQGCGVSIIDTFFRKKIAQVSVHLIVEDGSSLQVGDIVYVGLQKNAFLKSSLLVYFLPLVFMFCFSLIGQYIYTIMAPINALVLDNEFLGSESLEIGFAIMGLVSGFYFVKYISRKISNDGNFRVVLLKD